MSKSALAETVLQVVKASAHRPKRKIEVPLLSLPGEEKNSDALIKAKQALDKAMEDVATARALVEPVASEFRLKSEKAGTLAKTISVLGTSLNASFFYKDAFSKIDGDNVGTMKTILGDNFDKLFVEREETIVRPEMVVDLKVLLGETTTEEFLQTKRWVAPIKDFRKQRFLLRGTLGKEAEKFVDDLIGKIAHRPEFEVK